MGHRKFIETSVAAAGAAVLGSVKPTFNETQAGSKTSSGKKVKNQAWSLISGTLPSVDKINKI